MQQVLKQQLLDEHDFIRSEVKKRDKKADIYLFGPGSEKAGQTVDLYIFSETLHKEAAAEIKQGLLQQLCNHIDQVVISNNSENRDIIAQISKKI